MPPKQLKVLSYNILDVELESNFVPRTMHPSSIKIINAASPLINPNTNNTIFKFPIDEKTKKNKTVMDVLGGRYVDTFHKGFRNGKGDEINKSDARQLWAKEDASDDETAPKRNLIQTLTDIFGVDEATRLYNAIKEFNDANNKWDAPRENNRLNRVYNKINSYDADIICLQEYGNCKDLPNKTNKDMQLKFDKPPNNGSTFASVENVNNDQNAVPEDGSLAKKLMLKGYHYKLFSHNPFKDDGDDGLAIFYKDATFSNENKKYIDMDAVNKQKTYIDKKTRTPKNYETQRGCGLLELTIRDTGQKVVICTTHIQTPSNEPNPIDGDGYEIRRGELMYIKKYIQDNYQGQSLIFCGDLNLDLNNSKDKAVIDDFESGFLKRIKVNPEPNDDFGLVTSYPSLRQEYLDYFFTNCDGTVTGEYKPMSDLVTAKKGGTPDVIPNSSDQPSDHIPILLTIPLPLKVEPQQGGGKKSRRRRRKTQKKPKRKTRRNNKRKNSKSKK